MFYKVIKNGRVIDVLDRLSFVKYYLIPSPEYDTVSLEEIDQYEYEQLKALGGKTPEAIIDAYTLSLIQGGLL